MPLVGTVDGQILLNIFFLNVSGKILSLIRTLGISKIISVFGLSEK